MRLFSEPGNLRTSHTGRRTLKIMADEVEQVGTAASVCSVIPRYSLAYSFPDCAADNCNNFRVCVSLLCRFAHCGSWWGLAG